MSIKVNIKHDKEFQPKITENCISFENSEGEKIRINLPENSNVTTISEEEINLIMNEYKIIEPNYIKMREEETLNEIDCITEETMDNCLNRLLTNLLVAFILSLIFTIIINYTSKAKIDILMNMYTLWLLYLMLLDGKSSKSSVLKTIVPILIFIAYTFLIVKSNMGELDFCFSICVSIISIVGFLGIVIFKIKDIKNKC